MTLEHLMERRLKLAELVARNEAAIARSCREYCDANGYRMFLRPEQVLRDKGRAAA